MKDRDELDNAEHYTPMPSRHPSLGSNLIPFGILIGSALVLILLARSCAGSVVTPALLDAIEQIESRGNPHAVGDSGRARGSFQIWATAWEDVNDARVERGMARIAYLPGVTNRAVARSFAREYLLMIESRLAKSLQRPPTLGELYAAYNCGPSRFERLGSSLHRTPRTTQRAVFKLHTILAGALHGQREDRKSQCAEVRSSRRRVSASN